MILRRSCSVAWGNPNSHGLIKLWRTTAFYNSPVLGLSLHKQTQVVGG